VPTRNKKKTDGVEAVSTSGSKILIDPVFLTKPTIECVWHTESNKISTIAMVLCHLHHIILFSIELSKNKICKCSSLCSYSFHLEYHHGSRTKPVAVGGTVGSVTFCTTNKVITVVIKVYSIDLGGNGIRTETTGNCTCCVGINSQYEEITSQLTCIKLVKVHQIQSIHLYILVTQLYVFVHRLILIVCFVVLFECLFSYVPQTMCLLTR
jgi:steroid 5-alpha reductase family enzyme